MLASFPAPVLSIAADAVRELEGRDALSGLWTLFTKCKESIQDGRRLENISWRLWYRDMMLSSQFDKVLSSEKSSQYDSPFDQTVYRPDQPTPPETQDFSAAFTAVEPDYQPTTHSEARSISPFRTPFVPLVRRRPSSVRTQSGSALSAAGPSMSVGQFICDILPSSNLPLVSPSGKSLGGALSLPSMSSTTIVPEAETTRNARTAMTNNTTFLERMTSISDLPTLPIHESVVETVVAPTILPPIPEAEDGELLHARPLSSSSSSSPATPAQSFSFSSPAPTLDRSSSSASLLSSSSASSPSGFYQKNSDTNPSSLIPISSESPACSAPSAPSSTASTQTPTSSIIPQIITCPTINGPPSPSLSDSYARAHPHEVTVSVLLSPAQTQNLTANLSARTTTAAPAELGHSFAPDPPVQSTPPLLVVVNPTPGPTPHPTPPTTPLLLNGSGKKVHGQYLTPPGKLGVSNLKMTPLLLPIMGDESDSSLVLDEEAGCEDDIGVSQAAGGNVRSPSARDLNVDLAAGLATAAVAPDICLPVLAPVLSQGRRQSLTTNEDKLAEVSPQLPPVQQEAYIYQLQRSQNQQQYLQLRQFQHQRQASEVSQRQQQQHRHRHSLSSTASSSQASSSQLSIVATSVTGTIDDPLGPTTVTKDAPNHGITLPWALAMTLTMPRPLPPSELVHRHALPPSPHTVLAQTRAPLVTSSVSGSTSSATVASAATATSPISPSASASPGPFSLPSHHSSRSPASPTTSHSGINSKHNHKLGGLVRRASSGTSASGNNRNRNTRSTRTSSSTSGGASTKVKSRSRSQEAGIGANNVGLVMAAIGITNPTAGTTRKAGGRGAGKSRIIHGRSASGKVKGLGAALARTLSREEVVEQDEEEDENEEDEGDNVVDKKEKERVEREKAVAAQELREREREISRQLESRRDQEKLRELTLREEEFQREQERVRQRDRDAGKLKRPVKFNIGSNSDEGSGIGSKSAGSSSDISGNKPGNTLNVGASDVMAARIDGAVVNIKGKDRAHVIDRLDQQNRLLQVQRAAALAIMRDAQSRSKVKADAEGEQERREGERKEADAAALAKAKQSIAAPLLPPAQKRTIVLATSESEYTDTDDESWTTGEGTEEDVEIPPPQARQLSQPELRQQHSPSHQVRQGPAPLQRTQSSTIGNRSRQQQLRAQQQRREAQVNVEKATVELQRQQSELRRQQVRQREMFTKLPSASFQNLRDMSRTRSVGLLTQLMNPDPTIFPPTHPYRRGYSSSEIPSSTHSQMNGRAGPSVPVLRKQTQAKQLVQQRHQAQALPQQPQPPTAPVLQERSRTQPPSPQPRLPHGGANPPSRLMRGPGSQMSKTKVALPVSSRLQVGSVQGKGVVTPAAVAPAIMYNTTGSGSGGYRPRGPPQGQELEDTESEDEAASGIQLSKSIAHEKLKALARRGGIVAHANRVVIADGNPTGQGLNGDEDDSEVPIWARASPARYAASAAAQQNGRRRSGNHGSAEGQHYNLPNPAPIPLGFPYHLPAPAPPSTPRTTRRLMLQTEMSESLRRNLLWERQVSKVNLAGVRRSSSGGGSGGGSRGNVLGGLQPLTAAPSMVQLHAKGTTSDNGDNFDNMSKGSDRERRASGGRETSEVDDKKQRAMARNHSWGNDYHTSGW